MKRAFEAGRPCPRFLSWLGSGTYAARRLLHPVPSTSGLTAPPWPRSLCVPPARDGPRPKEHVHVEDSLEKVLSLVDSVPSVTAVQGAQIVHLLARRAPRDAVSAALQPVLRKYSQVNSSQQAKDLLSLSARDGSSQKETDSRLEAIFRVLSSKRVNAVETRGLVSCIKDCDDLGVTAANSFIVRNMENALIWRARTCTIRDLAFLLSFSVKRRKVASDASTVASVNFGNPTKKSDSQLNDQLYSEVVKSVERRWVEVSDAPTIAGLVHYYPEVFGDRFISKMEDRTIELAESMSAEDLCLILRTMASKKRRTVPALRSVAYHLVRKSSDLDLKSISDCLFALKELAFKDMDLIESLCHTGANRVRDSPAFTLPIRSILTSLGQLKYRHRPLLDAISAKMVSQIKVDDGLKVKDLLAFLITAANLNYVPEGSSGLFKEVNERLTPESFESRANDGSKKDSLWLDVVWSLVVLNKAGAGQVESVLVPEFYNKLLYSYDRRNVGAILKLLNVNGAAEVIEGYKGPVIAVKDDPLLRDIKAAPRREENANLVTSVVEAFSKLAPRPAFMGTEVNTFMGFQLDGAALFEVTSMKPQPLPEGFKGDAFFEPSAAAAGSHRRVALLVAGYHDCLSSDGGAELGGVAALCVRLLESRGLTVVVVRHHEVPPKQKQLEKVRILEQKLRDALQRGSNNSNSFSSKGS